MNHERRSIAAAVTAALQVTRLPRVKRARAAGGHENLDQMSSESCAGVEVAQEDRMRRFHVTVNGQAYEVTVEEVQAAPPHPPAPAPPKSSGEAGRAIRAPMPGTVLEVKVAPGEAVTGQSVLLVLEAMKMENDIMAPGPGRVKSIAVGTGDAVNSGDVLVIIE